MSLKHSILVVLGCMMIGISITPSSAQNNVVVIPLGENCEPEPNMACQDGGLAYGNCILCLTAESNTDGCCESQTQLCADDQACSDYRLCIASCTTQLCIDACTDAHPDGVELFNDIQICLNGDGSPNMDGACGLVCQPD